jgi:NADPH-dependent 7-cyano-7-deazaguanine reductase QueF-like protein
MAAPNIVNISTLTGKTTYVNLTTTGSTSVLSNASGSNRVYKINSLFVSNTDTATAVNVTVNYYDSSSISAATTSGSIAGTISIPAKSNLIILDKSTALYLEENDAIGAIAGTAAKLTVICSYEDIG